MSSPFAVIDLFSGPGGLGEGFAAPSRRDASRRDFRIALSIEKDAAAHRTLRLRAFLRKFPSGPPDEYYEFLDGSTSREPDWTTLFPKEWEEARRETPHVALGTDTAATLLRSRIRVIHREHGDRTVLLGGPPCQAYSVAGRARNAGNPNYDIRTDSRLSLYREYARILGRLQPAIAVMENVRGILSARYDNQSVFEDVMHTLQSAGGNSRYKLFTLSPETGMRSWSDGLDPRDFLIRSEKHGVPQRRHRVFVVCIRSDIASELPENMFPKLEPQEDSVTVKDVIGSMPMLRSRLSRGDTPRTWQIAVERAHELVSSHLPEMPATQENKFRSTLKLARDTAIGESLPYRDETAIRATDSIASCPRELGDWLCDKNLTRPPNNETRGHMDRDIARYLFAAVYARTLGRSPRSADFPDELAPYHMNWMTGKFTDRFRVQLADSPASTITSHISKDGHYFIHPDPRQCRSLTVREAARLQTFPDNYFFHGGRTQQYVQVGNAVPPYLAWQIAEQVSKTLRHRNRAPVRSFRQAPDKARQTRREADVSWAEQRA